MESRTRKSVRAGDFPVSLIMADCNYLKRTNDTLGHEYGDKLLKCIADIIKETIPENYIAMRVGGDEFLILCPHCPAEKASEIVDEMRRLLNERSDETLTLSASFGIHTVESPAEGSEFSFKEAYEMADRAMYIDKQAAHAAGRTVK